MTRYSFEFMSFIHEDDFGKLKKLQILNISSKIIVI